MKACRESDEIQITLEYQSKDQGDGPWKLDLELIVHIKKKTLVIICHPHLIPNPHDLLSMKIYWSVFCIKNTE